MLEYSDTSSPGGLGGGRGLACACLGLMPSWAQGAHRLLGATLGSAQGLPSWACSASRSGEGQVPRGHQTGLQSPMPPPGCPQAPVPAPPAQRGLVGAMSRERLAPPGRWALGHSPGSTLLMPVSRAGLQPCQSLCPLPVTRGGDPDGEGAGARPPTPPFGL